MTQFDGNRLTSDYTLETEWKDFHPRSPRLQVSYQKLNEKLRDFNSLGKIYKEQYSVHPNFTLKHYEKGKKQYRPNYFLISLYIYHAYLFVSP